MNFKSLFITAFGFVAPSHLMKANQVSENDDDTIKIRTEQQYNVKPIIQDVDTAKFKIQTKLTNTSDSINQDSIKSDTIAADTLKINVTDSDSVAVAWAKLSPREKLRSCADMMLLYISQFEDIKANAYYDRAAKKWTIGPGLTYINNRPVTSKSKIQSVEEMQSLWRDYCEKENGMFDAAEKFLPLDLERPGTAEELTLAKARICAIIDGTWNVGNGFLGRGDKPSNWVSAYKSFLETGDSIYLNKCKTLYCSYNKVRKKVKGKTVAVELPPLTKRRNLSWEVFTGNIKLSEEVPTLEQLAENTDVWYLHCSALGDAYRFFDRRTKKLDDEWVEKLNKPTYGRNFRDTLNFQFNLKPHMQQKSTSNSAIEQKLKQYRTR